MSFIADELNAHIKISWNSRRRIIIIQLFFVSTFHLQKQKQQQQQPNNCANYFYKVEPVLTYFGMRVR